jgi:hypothetical protein
MDAFKGKRHAVCVPHGSPVTIKDDRSGFQYPASMHTDSRKGVFLEANYAPRPGSTLHILFDNREGGSGACVCAAVIRWRRMLSRLGSTYSYGLGIKYV